MVFTGDYGGSHPQDPGRSHGSAAAIDINIDLLLITKLTLLTVQPAILPCNSTFDCMVILGYYLLRVGLVR